MAYQVFARKYRPQTFREIIGQDAVVRTLTNALRLGRIAQAYLFVGPRGTGKTSTARILSKALEASPAPTADFDPADDTSRDIAEGRYLDVLEIDGASNNGVEEVRNLRDNVRYAPAKGRYKIYIIDEVHMLSTQAFNALLKTLEEPPPHVKFIFATTEVHKLPATILSRCQRFDLRRIPEESIRAHLAKICALEGVEAEPGALEAIARHAEGGMRDAESALDQAISFYGDRVSTVDVHSLFGLTGFGPVAELGKALAAGNAGEVLRQARTLISAGKDLGKLSQDLLAFFRNLVIFQVSPEALEKELSMAEGRALSEVAGTISRGAALDVLNELSLLENRLRYALAKDVIFEVALIQMSQLREKVSLERVLEAIEGSSSLPTAPIAKAPIAPVFTAQAPAPKVEPVPPAPIIKEVIQSESLPKLAPVEKEPQIFKEPALIIVEKEPAFLDVGPEIETVAPPAPVSIEEPVELSIAEPDDIPIAEPAPSPLPALVIPEPQIEPAKESAKIPEPVIETKPKIEAPIAQTAPVFKPVEPALAKIAPTLITGALALEAWKEAVEKFAIERAVEADTIRALEFLAAKGDTIEISLPAPLSKKIHYLKSPRNIYILESSLKEKLGRAVQVIFIITTPRQEEGLVADAPREAPIPGKPTAPPPTMTQEQFVNDPAIQHALKIFEAKLISTNKKDPLK